MTIEEKAAKSWVGRDLCGCMGQHSPPRVSGELLQTPGSAHGMIPHDLWWTTGLIFCHWNHLLQVLLPKANEGALHWSLITSLFTLSLNTSTVSAVQKKSQTNELGGTILSITQTLREWTQNEGKNWLSRKAGRAWATGKMQSPEFCTKLAASASESETQALKNWCTPLVVSLSHLWYSSVPLQVCN